jgi:hypothetical protein
LVVTVSEHGNSHGSWLCTCWTTTRWRWNSAC